MNYKIDYNLSNLSSKTIKKAKIQEFLVKNNWCSLSLLNNEIYLMKCSDVKKVIKKSNQEIYKRFIKPFYIPL